MKEFTMYVSLIGERKYTIKVEDDKIPTKEQLKAIGDGILHPSEVFNYNENDIDVDYEKDTFQETRYVTIYDENNEILVF